MNLVGSVTIMGCLVSGLLMPGVARATEGAAGVEVGIPAPSGPNIVYVDGQPLTVQMNSQHVASTSVPVRNIGSDGGRAEFCTLLEREKNAECIRNVMLVGTEAEIRGGQVVALSIRMSSVQAPVSGYIGLATYDASNKMVALVFRPIKINAPLITSLAWYPIGAGLAASVALCLFSFMRLRRAKVSLSSRMGLPSWDFSKSWASNITVAGALFSLGLSISALPDQTRYISRGGYGVLNLVFALLVTIGPFCFNVFRKAVLPGGQDESQLQFQGYVSCFLIASGVTIWAVTGQLITLAILLDEFVIAGLAAAGSIRFFQTIIAILWLGVMLYGVETMYWTARSQMAERNRALEKLAGIKGVSAMTVKGADVSLSSWAIL